MNGDEKTQDSFSTVTDRPQQEGDEEEEPIDEGLNHQVQQELVNLNTKTPMKLSEYLNTHDVFTEDNLLRFELKALKITEMKSVPERLKTWLHDYTLASARLRKLTVVQKQGTSNPAKRQQPSHQPKEMGVAETWDLATQWREGTTKDSEDRDTRSADENESGNTPLLQNVPPLRVQPASSNEVIPKFRLNELIIRNHGLRSLRIGVWKGITHTCSCHQTLRSHTA